MRRRLSVPEALAIIALIAALVSLVVGSVVAAIALIFAAIMGSTRMFERARGEGKATLSNTGRLAVAVTLVVIASAFTLAARSRSGTSPSPAPTLGKTDAIDVCKEGVVARASHPSTVEFPTFDYDFREYADRKSELLMSAKMRNGFNLLVEFDVQCDFTGGTLDDVIMSEAKPRS